MTVKCCLFHTCTQPSPSLRKTQNDVVNDAADKSGLRECSEAEVVDPLYFLTASILDMICRYGSVQQVLPGSFHTGSCLRKRNTAGRMTAFCCIGTSCEGVDWYKAGRQRHVSGDNRLCESPDEVVVFHSLCSCKYTLGVLGQRSYSNIVIL